MSFTSLGLTAELLRAVQDQNYTVPTPVQLQAIPAILAGRDVLAGAQTGTGKTAAFTLPILQRLGATAGHEKKRRIRTLVLVPTRELAAQVEQSVTTYGRHTPLQSTTVFGGVKISTQISRLQRGVDILVATPGRLLDHVSQKTVDMSRVEILVLDEADRMLDMGFINDIRRIISYLPPTRQNLMFSATFPAEIKRLAEDILVKPERIQLAADHSVADNVTHIIHPVDLSMKRELLTHLVQSNDWQQVLVFTRTKHSAERLSKQLGNSGVRTTAIHGNKTQGQRTRALEDFKRGKVRVMVATDVASRGLDIELLPHVINYELPNVSEDYVHRIGRTGRAGNTGTAISLVAGSEMEYLKNIERLLKMKLPQTVVAGFEPDPRVQHLHGANHDRAMPGSGRQSRNPNNGGGGAGRKFGRSNHKRNSHSGRSAAAAR